MISAKVEGIEVKDLPLDNPVETLFALNKVLQIELYSLLFCLLCCVLFLFLILVCLFCFLFCFPFCFCFYFYFYFCFCLFVCLFVFACLFCLFVCLNMSNIPRIAVCLVCSCKANVKVYNFRYLESMMAFRVDAEPYHGSLLESR